MKTAHEILAADTIRRFHDQAEERRWAELVRRFRGPRGQMPFAVQVIWFAVWIGVFAFIGNQTGDYRLVYLGCGVLFFVGLPSHIWRLRRKEAALLAMIEQEAPDLFRRLKNEGIT